MTHAADTRARLQTDIVRAILTLTGDLPEAERLAGHITRHLTQQGWV